MIDLGLSPTAGRCCARRDEPRNGLSVWRSACVRISSCLTGSGAWFPAIVSLSTCSLFLTFNLLLRLRLSSGMRGITRIFLGCSSANHTFGVLRLAPVFFLLASFGASFSTKAFPTQFTSAGTTYARKARVTGSGGHEGLLFGLMFHCQRIFKPFEVSARGGRFKHKARHCAIVREGIFHSAENYGY